ncbi:MAG: SDR family NAD(P)-dependent oxidoreductase [Gammaproteobacteria bacterium]|nr:SDR family NAD(P)-dependent oxidoreductase [Gammaproteobacteria bacterium]
MRCRNQQAFVIGASTEVGVACAELLAREGARLFICGDDFDKLNALALSLRSQFLTEVDSARLNAVDPVLITQLFANLAPAWQAPDIIFNVAELPNSLPYQTVDQLKEWLELRRQGLLTVNRRFISQMKLAGKGSIVNLNFPILPNDPKLAELIWQYYRRHALADELMPDVEAHALRLSRIEPRDMQANTAVAPADIAETALFCSTRPDTVGIEAIRLYSTADAEVKVEESV